MAASLSPELSILFGRLRPCAPIAFGDLTLVPLVLDRAFDVSADADLLEEGLLHGRTTISEVDERGRVGTVRVRHEGARLLLLVDGEQILGAKQNRVFNASFLVPPGASVDLPVSCVERERWRYETSTFRASAATLTTVARARKLGRVTTSIASSDRYDADQGEVWRDVDGYLERTQTLSPTSSIHDGMAVRASAVQRRIERLTPLPRQVGLATVRADEVVAIDVFGSPSLFSRGWRKVARGVLSEDFEERPPCRDAVSAVARALTTLSRLPVVRRSAPGLGETLHGSHGGYVAGAVVHRRRLYHAVVAGQVQA